MSGFFERIVKNSEFVKERVVVFDKELKLCAGSSDPLDISTEEVSLLIVHGGERSTRTVYDGWVDLQNLLGSEDVEVKISWSASTPVIVVGH